MSLISCNGGKYLPRTTHSANGRLTLDRASLDSMLRLFHVPDERNTFRCSLYLWPREEQEDERIYNRKESTSDVVLAAAMFFHRNHVMYQLGWAGQCSRTSLKEVHR